MKKYIDTKHKMFNNKHKLLNLSLKERYSNIEQK